MSVFNVDDNTDYECYDNMTYIPRRRQYPIKSYLPNIIENDIKDYNPYFFPNDHFKRFVTCSLGKYDHPPMELMDAMRHFFQKVLDWTFLPNYDKLNDVDILDQVMNFVKNHKVLYNYGPNWFKLVAIPRDYDLERPVQQRMLSSRGIPTRVGNLPVPRMRFVSPSQSSIPQRPPITLDERGRVRRPPTSRRPISQRPLTSSVRVEEIDDEGNSQPLVPRIDDIWDMSSSDSEIEDLARRLRENEI